MKRPFFQRFIAASVLIGAVLGTASVAQAHTDVQFSIGVPGLPVVVAPEPVHVYARPEPVYVQPRPVYVPPPAIVYERDWRPSYRYEYEREREWRHREWQRREWERRHHEGDHPSRPDRHWRD